MSNTVNLKVDKETQNKITRNEYLQIGNVIYIRKDYVIKTFGDFIDDKIANNEIQILNEAIVSEDDIRCETCIWNDNGGCDKVEPCTDFNEYERI